MWGLLEILLAVLLLAFFAVLFRVKGRKAHNVETLVRKRVVLTVDEARNLATNLTGIVDTQGKWASKTCDLQRSETSSEIITFEIRK